MIELALLEAGFAVEAHALERGQICKARLGEDGLAEEMRALEGRNARKDEIGEIGVGREFGAGEVCPGLRQPALRLGVLAFAEPVGEPGARRFELFLAL
jgi:hypothetical protein